jgi:hypothetical protein
MKSARRTGALILALLLMGITALAQSERFGNIAERQRTSTVLGGTGMFNTFSTRTLYKGEFNFALFWNNYDRDPGALDINQVPFNITVGLTNRWEIWVDWVTWQQTTSRQPFLLSGYQYNAVRIFGNPVQILGPAIGGHGGAAFFPGTGASGGGILPALGRFAIPVGGDGLSTLNSPAGAGRSPVVGLGPAIVLDQPNYFNDLPMFGVVDFLGFDALGRPVLGPRQSANGSGDVYFGSKYNLIDPNRHWFSLALGGYVKFPISRDDQARARGRTSGEYEFGPMLIFGQEFYDHRVRLYENIGYIHTTDIHAGGVKTLDLRDKLQLNIGGAVSVNRYIELVGELAGTVYIGGSTPSFQRANPLDLNLGARFFFRDGTISFGGAYRRQLNGIDARDFAVLECETIITPPDDHNPHDWSASTKSVSPAGGHYGPPPPPPPPRIECKQRQVRFGSGDRNGFVGFFSVGVRKGCPPPPVPTCVLEASGSVLTRGDRLSITVRPSVPGYSDIQVSYSYRWEVRDAQGRAVPVNGSGPTVDVSTARLNCGTYTASAIVGVSVTSSDHPECPNNTAQSTCVATFEVTEPPCPAITCDVIAANTTVTEGDRVALRVTASGGDNLSYLWTTTGGRLSSTTGREVTLNTTGITGSVTVSVRVSTDRTRCDQPCPGGSCATTITVREVPPPPERPKVSVPCGPIFFPFNSARINNEHKACLDEVAILMQQDPRTTLVIDGHRDGSERAGISLTRAYNARDYLVTEKGIDTARITVRNFSDSCPYPGGDAKLNRRVEFWVIPEGASISDINAVKQCAPGARPRIVTDEQPAPSAEPRRPKRRSGRPEPGEADLEDDDTAPDNDNSARPVNAVTPPVARAPQSAAVPTRNEAALGKATVVRGVSARVVDGMLRIVVDTDGLASFKDFTLTGPSRIVVDINGVRNAFGNKNLAAIAGSVERVRVGEPSPGVVRIVLDVKTMLRYQVVREGSQLVILISRDAVAASPGQ